MNIINLKDELNKVIEKKDELFVIKENDYEKLNDLIKERIEILSKRDNMHSLLFDRVLIVLTFLMMTGVNVIFATNSINIIVGILMDVFLGGSFIKNLIDVDKLENSKNNECSTFELRCNEKVAKLDKEINIIKDKVCVYNDSIKEFDNIINELKDEINKLENSNSINNNELESVNNAYDNKVFVKSL